MTNFFLGGGGGRSSAHYLPSQMENAIMFSLLSDSSLVGYQCNVIQTVLKGFIELHWILVDKGQSSRLGIKLLSSENGWL